MKGREVWKLFATAALALAGAKIGRAQFTPAPGSPFMAGAGPAAIAVGDFNGDTLPDLAIADSGNATTSSSGTVTILLGTLTGGFTPAPMGKNPIAIANPTAIVTGDFNGDGILDLAVASMSGNLVMVYFGNGDGTFQPGTAVTPAMNAPSGLVAGNFQSTQCSDLAVAYKSPAGSNVALFLNPPACSGSFTQALYTPAASSAVTGNDPAAIAAGTLNGHPLFAVPNELDGTVSVFLWNGGSNFTPLSSPSVLPGTAPPTPKPFPVAVAIADVNNDGLPDLITANEGTNNISVLLNSSSGQFTLAPGSPIAVGAQPVALVVQDFNHDGKKDIAVASYGANTVSVLSGLGNGAFQAPVNLSAPAPVALAAGDFNNDGNPDLATANMAPNNSVSVYLNSCCGLTMVSSASGAHLAAPASLVSIYGSGLAGSTLAAPSLSLPVSLGGTSVTITYSDNSQDVLQLYYVSPAQINAVMPAGAKTGAATYTVFAPGGTQFGNITIAPLAPAIFSANESGTGVAWAQFVSANLAFSNAFQCPSGGPGTCIPLPWNVSAPGSYLVLYGTGLHTANTSDVTVTIGGQSTGSTASGGPVLTYVGPSAYQGEDQINILLPTYTTNPGLVPVTIMVTEPGTKTVVYSNTVTVSLYLPGAH